MSQQPSETARSIAARFAAMVEAAPDEPDFGIPITDHSPAPPTEVPERYCTLRMEQGWGAKYVEPVELHGDQWLRIFDQVKEIVARNGIVALLGKRGTGKTRMAAEVARSGCFAKDHGEWNGLRMVRDRTPLYRRTLDVFLDLREASNSRTTSEKKVLAELEKPGLLVMDEFHERGGSDWENRIVSNLIDKRYSAERPTILIANFTVAEMGTAVGPSVADRMRENGKAFLFDWDSYRRHKP